MTHRLEADSIFLHFGERRILSDIYIKCETGKITGLLGRNGTGKSSLMNIIYGSLACPDKSVRFDGKSVPQAYRKPTLLAYLPQFDFVPKSLSLYRVFKDFQLDFNEFKVFFPGLPDDIKTRFGELSGGSRRLVETFLVIKTKSQFTILDEPFSHIMPVHVDKIKELIACEKQSKGFLITDHLYKNVMEISDHLYVLANGKTHLTKNIEDIETLGYAHI